MTYYIRSDHASEMVTLTEHEFRAAWVIGEVTWAKSQRDGRSDRMDGVFAGERGQRKQCLGSLCEEIAAKCLGVYRPRQLDVFADADLPYDIEVKLIGVSSYGLRVYDRTPDSRRVIGVVVPQGEESWETPYRVAGWYPAHKAKRGEWRMAPRNGPPMYCVPQYELRPPAELRALIAAEILEAAGHH